MLHAVLVGCTREYKVTLIAYHVFQNCNIIIASGLLSIYKAHDIKHIGYYDIGDRICENPTLPGFIDFVLEPIIVTQQHFGENAVITATGQQTHGLQDIGV